MMKKRISILLLVLMLAAVGVVAGCGDNAKPVDPAECTIEFFVDGESYKTAQVKSDATFDMPQDPTKRGYTFGGWFTDETFQSALSADHFKNESYEKETKAYAKFTANVYTLSFEGKDVSENISVTYDSAIGTLPEAPEQAGYNAGWKIDDVILSADTVWNFTEDKTATVSLVAKEYTLSFEGAEEEVAAITVTYGEKIENLPSVPYKKWYNGVWKIDDVVITKTSIYDYTENKTATAEYVLKDDKAAYTVKIYAKLDKDAEYTDVTDNYSDYVGNLTGKVETEVDITSMLDDIPHVGFTLNAEKSVLKGTVEPDGSLELKAYYDINVYRIVYLYNGGKEFATEEVAHGKDIVTALPQSTDYIKYTGWVTSDRQAFGKNVQSNATVYADASVSVIIGDTYKPVVPLPFAAETVSYTSKNANIATVADTGEVTATGFGSTKITATAGNVTYDVDVTVEQAWIYTAAEFMKIQNTLAGEYTYVLKDDIDLTVESEGYTVTKKFSWGATEYWDDANSVVTAFAGTLDGNGHSVKMEINEGILHHSDTRYVFAMCLFARNDGTIKNALFDINFTNKDADQTDLCLVNWGTIENVAYKAKYAGLSDWGIGQNNMVHWQMGYVRNCIAVHDVGSLEKNNRVWNGDEKNPVYYEVGLVGVVHLLKGTGAWSSTNNSYSVITNHTNYAAGHSALGVAGNAQYNNGSGNAAYTDEQFLANGSVAESAGWNSYWSITEKGLNFGANRVLSVKRTIKFTVEGAEYASLSVPTDGAITLPQEPTKTGHTFVGWFTDDETFENEFTQAAFDASTEKEITVYAKFTPSTYTLSFEDMEESYNITVTYGSAIGTLPNAPAQTGYDAVWKIGDVILTADTVWEFTEDKTATVSLVAKKYTLSFSGAEEEVQSITVTYDDFIDNLPDVPAREGYTGVWKIDDKVITKASKYSYAEDKTATAVYSKDNASYSVKIYSKDDVNAEYVDVTDKYSNNLTGLLGEVGSTADITEIANNLKPKEGYALNTEKSVLTGAIVADGSLVLTVYYDINVYTVRYLYDGGTALSTVQVAYGKDVVPVALPQNTDCITYLDWVTADTQAFDGKNIKSDTDVYAAFKISAKIGYRDTLTAKLPFTSDGVSWLSNNETVVTVDAGSGEVTATGFGTAQITATVGEASYDIDVTVDTAWIYTAAEFMKIQNTLADEYTYVLKADIDLTVESEGYTVTTKFSWGAEVCESYPTSFKGVFDGNGHKVTMTLNDGVGHSLDSDPAYDICLFGKNEGTVKNTFFELSFTRANGRQNGLIKQNYGTVENVAYKASCVTGSDWDSMHIAAVIQNFGTVQNVVAIHDVGNVTNNNNDKRGVYVVGGNYEQGGIKGNNAACIQNCVQIAINTSNYLGETDKVYKVADVGVTGNVGLVACTETQFFVSGSVADSAGWNSYWSITDEGLKFGEHLVLAKA